MELQSLLRFDYLKLFEEIHYEFEIPYDQNTCLEIMSSMIANDGRINYDDIDLTKVCSIDKVANQLVLKEVLNQMISEQQKS